MKKIILKSLTLTNFRGENRTTEFNPDETTIFGRNKLGKSRHFDAFLWLLFGKDKEGRDNYEIKTRIKGEELHEVECSVVGVLDIDGSEVTLKRELSEKWVKPRGETERILKGNETLCWWNNVPVQVGEYNNRVKAIIDENVFKMITNPKHFFGLKWQDQRDMLFQIVGTVSDQEIANTKAEFVALLDKLSGKSLADFKAELSARKKRLKSELNEIQPRIDQTQKLMPKVSNFAELDKELEQLDAKIAELDGSIHTETEKIKKHNEDLIKRENKIAELHIARQRVVLDAKSKAEQEVLEANAKRNDIIRQLEQEKRAMEGCESDVNNATRQCETCFSESESIDKELETLRSKWHEENAKEYRGETTCHCCGQELPEAMITKAKEIWNKSKIQTLEEISNKGKTLKERKESIEKAYSEAKMDQEHAKNKIREHFFKIKELNAELSSIQEAKAKEIIPADLEEYVSLSNEIDQLTKVQDYDKQVIREKCSTDALEARKRELVCERDNVKSQLSNRDRIAECENQISKLHERGNELAQQIADAEREEYTIAQFNKAKIEDSEKRINELFQSVKFKLSDYNIEDYKKENPIECCIPIVDGVYYSTSNTASQVNAGLDIINVMSQFFGITAPIFIDNREGVNDIIPTQGQIINLVVTRDEELIIK